MRTRPSLARLLPALALRTRARGVLLACAAVVMLAVAVPPARAAAAGDGAHASVASVSAAAVFSRGDPLPPWARPFAPLAPTVRTEPLVIRTAETQIHLGHGPADVQYLVNRAVQVNDAEALSQLGQYPLYFVPQYQRIRLHSVTLLRGNEVLERTASANVRFLDREQALERGIYSGMVTAVLLLDDVRVGDTLRLVYTLQGHNPVFGERYSHSVAWDHAEPVELRRATLIAPRERAIAWRLHGDHRPTALQPQELSAAGAPVRVLRFEERAIEPLDDESAVPEHYLAARFLQLTEYPDWNSVARWALTLFPQDAPLPASLDPMLARLRAIDDPAARAAEALRWVQEEIRYFSVSMGESSHRPSLPQQVLARRYGDCKDKTLLLVTLLRAVGLQADPVLVASSAPQLPLRLLPHPDAFDHVVAQVRIGQRTFTLDPTRLGQRGRLDRLGVMEGAAALAVRADATALHTLHSPDPLGLARQELDETFTVQDLGGAGRLHMRQTWHGTHAELMRLAFARMSAEQRRKQVITGYDRRYSGISLQGEPRVLDDAQANTLSVEADFEVPSLTQLQDGRWTLRFYPDPIASVLRLPEDMNRRFPATVARVPHQARYRLKVVWPEAVGVVRPPQTQRVPSEFFLAEVQRSFRGNVAEVQMELAARHADVAPEALSRLAGDLRRLEHAAMGVVAVDVASVKRAGFLGMARRNLHEVTLQQLDRQIERNTWAIDGGQLMGDDLADALCERAEARAERGRLGDGLADARRAVAEAPAHGRAHACLGQLLFANRLFDEAVPAYTKALTLGEEAAGVLYRRGHARFYTGAFESAAQDFGKVVALRAGGSSAFGPRREFTGATGDEVAHAQLWQAWALKRAGLPLPSDWTTPPASAPWPRSALALAVGALPPERLLAQLQDRLQGDALELALTEAWFHLGQHYRVAGDAAKARQAFENARSRALPVAVEHWAAGFELTAAAPALR